MKMKALIIFMVLFGLVILDGEGTTLIPIRTHSTRPDLHNPVTIEPDQGTRKTARMVIPYSYYSNRSTGIAILTLITLSSPTDNANTNGRRDRAPPLRI